MKMATMKAYRLHSYGGPETYTLDEVPTPKPGKGQVLVAVSTVAVNPFDWKLREGYLKNFMPLPLPTILGIDVVGTVAALGEGSSRFKVGDRVMTMSRALGAHAEYIAVDETILARVPKSLSDEEAATLPAPTLTAWTVLHAAGEVRPGMKILIHGASGVTGAFAVQYAKAAGAEVIGTASAKNRDYVLSLGADKFIDYQTEKFEEQVKNADLVFDFVLNGDDRNTTGRSWSVLKPNGAFVTVADPMSIMGGKIPPGKRGFFPQVLPDAAILEKLAQQVADKKIKSKIAQVFPRKDLVKAMEINKAGGTAGRLIVDFKKA
jgi:NADPH:quinone reductase-like Zn-dependent oxidoreductase